MNRFISHTINDRRFSEYIHTEISDGQKIHYHEWSMFDYSDNKIATFTVYVYDDEPETAYFSQFIVREDKRFNGFGKFVLNNLEKFIPESCNEIYLWVQKSSSKVVLSSEILIPWYERHGFVQVPEFEENDCFWLIKHITKNHQNQTK